MLNCENKFGQKARRNITLFSSFLLFLSVFSCKENKDDSKEHTIFRYNETSSINTLDPAFAKNLPSIWPCHQLFSGLVELNDSLEVVPDIAKRWTISENGKTYRFVLRKEVYFHKSPIFGTKETRSVKAQDFVFSFSRLRDPKVAAPGAWILRNVQNFRSENDSVLVVNLKKPFPAFLGLLSMKYASVVPREAFDDPTYDFRSHPIGTGPFKFKFWQEHVKLVLTKNERFYQKDSSGVSLPYLDYVTVSFLPDKQAAYLEFLQGKIDFISGLDNSYKDDLMTQSGDLNPKYLDRFNLIM